MKQALHILHIEDSKEDSELVHQLLLSNGLNCEVTRVETRPAVFEALEKGSFDLILADCKLPNFSGLRALEIAHALKPEIPFVFVSGTIGEETAIESLRNGATDYVLKDRLSRLAPAVRRALAEAEERTMCRQLQQRLREAGRLEAISTLSNGIAHDFNNILAIVLGHASLLTMESENPKRVVEISATISEAALRGSEIVQQLLAFAHKSDSRIVPTDLNRFLQANLEQVKERIPANVELSIEFADELPNVSADAGQLERMLANLMTNAIDAMPEGGTVRLSTQVVPAGDLPNVLPELASENYVCIRVTDTGRGIDSATREHVFEPFFTTKERGRATGLGLPVVYGLMQAHHGIVDVQSELEVGTTVSLYFPVLRANTPAPPPAVHFSDPALSGKETILIVEDEQDVSFFLETIFEAQGYRVHIAADYDRALAIFKEHKDNIQMVFSDIGLPRVDGITLCEQLKKMKPDLAVILGSGYPPKEFKSRINDLNLQAFLSKPYNTNAILQTVRKVFDGARVLHLAT